MTKRPADGDFPMFQPSPSPVCTRVLRVWEHHARQGIIIELRLDRRAVRHPGELFLAALSFIPGLAALSFIPGLGGFRWSRVMRVFWDRCSDRMRWVDRRGDNYGWEEALAKQDMDCIARQLPHFAHGNGVLGS